MSTNFPVTLDTYAAIVDNTNDVLAAHPNDRGDAIEALEAKVGVDSSAVTTSHDYKIDVLETAVRTVPLGGTGAATLTDHGILLGSGAGAVTPTAVMSNGQLLVGQTGADPLPKTISGAVTITAAGVAAVVSGSVDQAALKTTTVEVTQAQGGSGNQTVTGAGSYAFWPQVKKTGDAGMVVYICAGYTLDASYSTNVFMSYAGGTTGTAYVQFRYVQASGEVFWIFILREVATKKIWNASAAPDHCCFGNGGKPALCPHPFGDVFEKPDGKLYLPAKNFTDEVEREVEIIVINPSHKKVAEMRAEGIEGEDKPDRSFLQVVLEDYEVDDSTEPAWPDIPVTVGLQEPVGNEKTKILKKLIPKPQMVKTALLKAKNGAFKSKPS